MYARRVRGALKLSLQEIQRGSVANNSIVEARGWLRFSHSPRGGLIPRGRLQERLAGDWESLSLSSLEVPMQGSQPVAGNEGDMLTTWPVVCLTPVDWRTLGSCEGLEGGVFAPGDDRWKLLTDEV